ncbi:Serine-threonine/tyrosine-protein kinase, catalytic domain [Sesbania bispinosa]|nr:Serine-threonine/tyrosine-protein kinase, catalytic domain [Sesbania bispinosa]
MAFIDSSLKIFTLPQRGSGEGAIGTCGFGRVYKGVMPISRTEVAVKRMSHESRQGMREFVSEIVSMGRLRHRNLVSPSGLLQAQRKLLLVYDYMPNGSLDTYLYTQPKVTLNWSQRFRITKGVASGLFIYMKNGSKLWSTETKASNVLLDAEMNGRLGNFGLARLHDHGTDPQTTLVAGTLGYLAPEFTRTVRPPQALMYLLLVHSFWRLLVVGPIVHVGECESVILVDWVFDCWKKGYILEAKDPNLGTDYRSEEVKLVLKLGLLCSHSEPLARPSMRQVVQYLERDVPLPDLSLFSSSSTGLTFGRMKVFRTFQGLIHLLQIGHSAILLQLLNHFSLVVVDFRRQMKWE